jgi:inward rectifier potassium channel
LKEDNKDLGFGTKLTNPNTRLVNRDGSFNVNRRGLSFAQRLNPYHKLISMQWPKFILLLTTAFILINTFFACLYLLLGIEHLSGIRGKSALENFFEAFFFSAQTFTTVGYGGISPVGFGANLLAAFESMAGWMGFALAAGLLYGRFSRPVARILYSDNALIAPYKDISAFMFRMANQRDNELIEVEVQVMLSRIEHVEGGKDIRRFYPLKLEREKINFFSLSWTIVHPIDEESPLKGTTPDDFKESDTEFLVLVKAFDDTFSQTVHTRSSYQYDEVVWGAKFVSMFDEQQEGAKINLNLHRISDYTQVVLPEEMIQPVSVEQN